MQWPSAPPGDPARDFVTVRADRMELKEGRVEFDRRIAKTHDRHVLIFVHGYNTRFEEAVYRFAQVVHDSRADVVPLLFTWPSRGRALEYFYDRESASYSRDALEAVLQGVVDDPHVTSISMLSHSLGNVVAVEALRQMSIRNHGLSSKIKDIMLAAPDIDVDVFRRDIAEIEIDDKRPPITLFVSQDDRALGFSKLLAGEPRMGAVDPTAEPYRGTLELAHVHVIDLTTFASGDGMNHDKFASTDVVRQIGQRLAAGQPLTDAKSNLGETVGIFAVNATDVLGKVTATVVTAPFDAVDALRTSPLPGDPPPPATGPPRR